MLRSMEITFANGFSPFKTGLKPDVIRAMSADEGVADRLRVVAFAELQARDAFLWGAERFQNQAPKEWIDSWKTFAAVEDRHAQMLLRRMSELKIDPGARVVSDKLTKLCRLAQDHVTFLFLLSSAEERGMEAGFILGEEMKKYDAESAAIFLSIAQEEVEHVEMATAALKQYEYSYLKEKAKEVNALL